MIPVFIRLLALEKIRSFSPFRDLLTALLKLLFVLFIVFYVAGIAVFLGYLLKNYFEIENVPSFLNIAAVYYILAEFLARIFLQKRPLFDLNRYLHLPIKRAGIIHFLLGKSLLTTFSLIAVILFLPITIADVSAAYGAYLAAIWLGTIVALSLSLHWFVLWLNEAVVPSLPGFISVVVLAASPFLLYYFGIFNLGIYTAPFFSAALSGPLPLLVSLILCILSYSLIYGYYLKNAYLGQKENSKTVIYSRAGSGLFSRFGVPGVLADLELKLILRHKKSRGYLALSFLFLVYGLIFYDAPAPGEAFSISGIYLFVGIFITGLFFINYAQFFLSWNSSFFDFFMVKDYGLKNLISGKILLLSMTCIAAYILSLPYIYFGWQIILVHTAGLLYNLGFGIHMIVLISFWEPKPMDINKSALFNYEGVGISQLLMALPFFIAPYAIYIPVTILFNAYTALVVVCIFGLTGLFFQKQLINALVKILQQNRHKISMAFRSGT